MPNLILYNGKLHTQDENYPSASAIAIRDGKILALGNDDEILALAHKETEKIDLEGRRALPGLGDAHIHFYEWSLLLRGIMLDQTRSLAEIQQMVKEKVAQAQPSEWIIGFGWNHDLWAEPKLPTKNDLDALSPQNPVILWRKDAHLALVNSAALAQAQITSETPNPDMGVIGHDEKGEPNGLLYELAINLIRDIMPAVTNDVVDTAMRRATRLLHELGITHIHDFRLMGDEWGATALRAFQRLHAKKELKLRTLVMLPGEYLAEAARIGIESGFGDDILRIGGIKLFADGALGPRTAWMLENYSTEAQSGMPLTPMKELAEKIASGEKAGLTSAIHAIGDRAIRELLDVYAEILEEDKGQLKSRPKHRIEHLQHCHPKDLPRLAPLGLVASVQPLHLTEDMELVDATLGSERARYTYAFRDMLDAGTVLAFGSDCPVVSPNPYVGIQAALTRQRADGTPKEGWFPAQRLSIEEIIYAYTMGVAIAAGTENMLGSLTPGKLADMVVLENDIFEIPPLQIGKTKVKMTIFDGEILYRNAD